MKPSDLKSVIIVFVIVVICALCSSVVYSLEIDDKILLEKFISIDIRRRTDIQNLVNDKKNLEVLLIRDIKIAKKALSEIASESKSSSRSEDIYDNNIVDDYMKFILLLEKNIDISKNVETAKVVLRGIKAYYILRSGSKEKVGKSLSSKQVSNELWSGLFMPQYAHGNDGVFLALQVISDDYDEQVIAWAIENYKKYSPFILMEASRRLSSKDIDKAVYWYLVGLWKIRDEVKKCGKFAASDVPTYWRSYAKKFLLPKIHDLKLEKTDVIFRKNLKRIVNDWDQLIPPDNQSWLRCKGVAAKKENWLSINHSLKSMAEKQCNESM